MPGLSETALYFIGGVIKHAKALNAFTNPTTNSYKRLVPGFEAPVLLAYSSRNRSASCRIPYGAGEKAKRVEFRFPDALANPYLAYSALLMAGPRRHPEPLHPGDPMDKNLYDLPPQELVNVPTVCGSLREALIALENGPRLPHQGRRVLRRPDRRLCRAQVGRADALGDDPEPGRIRHVGLAFGPDTNASTEFQQTVYMLDLPETDANSLDTSLFLLREAVGEASFAPAAIDRERGIILSEERTRANPALRGAEDELGYLFKGDVLPTRMPIGSTDVIKTAGRDRFVEFYNAYYRPERATLIVAGDVDPDAMEAKIRAAFGTWKGKGKAGPGLPPATIATRLSDSHVHTEVGLPNRVSLAWVRPADLRPDSEAIRREQLVGQLGFAILNRRFARIAAGDGAPFVVAGAGRQDQVHRADVTQLLAIAQPGKWQDALAAIEQEQRRAVRFGFTQAELDREIADMRARLTAAAAGAGTRTSASLAQAMVADVDQRDVFTTPADNLALFEAGVRGLSAEQVSAATAKLFAGSGPLAYLNAPAPVEGGDSALAKAYADASKAEVRAGAVQEAKAWPYQNFGTPGTVAERHELAGLGATAIRFANGVRLTVKPTAFAKDEILVSVRIGSGQVGLPEDSAKSTWALPGAFALGGLGKISYEDLQQALASKVYAVNFAVGEDAFQLAGKTRTQDFATQLQLLAAYASDPGFGATGWNRFRAVSGTIHDRLASTPDGVASRDLGALIHAGDKRFATPTREEMAASTIEAAKAAVAGPLATGPIEIAIVGDVDVETAVRQVAATFGALPARKPAPMPASALRTAFPASNLIRETHGGRADQGLALIAWPTVDFYSDPKRARTLSVLASVLQLRLLDEIREKQGTTYSPTAAHNASQVFPGYGFIAAQIEAPPEKLDGFLADSARIAANLRDTPVGADELERARKPMVETMLRQQASNGWWLQGLADVQSKPGAAAAIASALDQLKAVTPADVEAAARHYLVDAKAWKLEVLPSATAARN
jgi:zinc protease